MKVLNGEISMASSNKTLINEVVTFGFKCPKCGGGRLLQGAGMVTAAYYPVILENGVNVNPDRNIRTNEYTCLNGECGCSFTVKSQYGSDDIVNY